METAEELGCEWVPVNHKNVTKRFVDEAQNRGFKTGVWTVDTEEDIRRALNLDTDSITSNRPDRVLELLDR